MTNGDKVRKMSDNELAKSVRKMICSCFDCPFFERCINSSKSCMELIEEWFREEAEE